MHRATFGRQRGSLKANFDAPQAKVSLSGPFKAAFSDTRLNAPHRR